MTRSYGWMLVSVLTLSFVGQAAWADKPGVSSAQEPAPKCSGNCSYSCGDGQIKVIGCSKANKKAPACSSENEAPSCEDAGYCPSKCQPAGCGTAYSPCYPGCTEGGSCGTSKCATPCYPVDPACTKTGNCDTGCKADKKCSCDGSKPCKEGCKPDKCCCDSDDGCAKKCSCTGSQSCDHCKAGTCCCGKAGTCGKCAAMHGKAGRVPAQKCVFMICPCPPCPFPCPPGMGNMDCLGWMARQFVDSMGIPCCMDPSVVQAGMAPAPSSVVPCKVAVPPSMPCPFGPVVSQPVMPVGKWTFKHGADGIVVSGPCVEGVCDSICCKSQEGWVVLQGHVHLKCVKDGRKTEVSADCVSVNMTDGQIQLNVAQSHPEGTPDVFKFFLGFHQ